MRPLFVHKAVTTRPTQNIGCAARHSLYVRKKEIAWHFSRRFYVKPGVTQISLMAVNPTQLAELSALLDQALDIHASEREAWLATPPTTDPVVLAALMRALQLPAPAGEASAMAATEANQVPTHSRSAAAYWLRSGRFSDMGLTGLAAEQGAADESIVAGATMDRYRLLRAIGSGGMGIVWLAERIDGDIVRPVALKLPLRLSGNRQIAERFTRERGVLAKLTHPNIATLYDAGVSDAGIPFLALEYVEGLPITDYADGKWLTVAARLALFAQVLAAVQHAHESLVIHRDLKPSNILVKADGTVKLLDFGIARLIEDGDEAISVPAPTALQGEPSFVIGGSTRSRGTDLRSELTRQVGIAVTPNYASPEQLAGKSLTTATDVYSLGVVLYELLTGVRPYRLKHESQAALAQGILDAGIVLPSQVELTDSAATLRRSTPSKLKHLLRCDLDAILIRALGKTTDKRYRTADEFAADLRRHREHEPVQAMPSNTLYRFKKFVIRHRVGVGAASAISLAILMGVGATAWQLRETEREHMRRNVVQNFLVGIFRTADPEVARGKTYTALELIDVSVERAIRQFADQPDVAAMLFGELGKISYALGNLAQASDLFARKVQLLDGLGRRSTGDYVDALTRQGRYQLSLGHADTALPLLQRAVTIAAAIGSDADPLRWEAMQRLALLQSETSDHAAATSLLETAYREITALPEDKRPARALWLIEHGLGMGALGRGDRMRALEHFTHVETLQRGDNALERSDVLWNEHNLAVIELSLRRFTSAERRLEAVIAERSKSFGSEGPSTLESKTEMSKVMLGLGKDQDAYTLQKSVADAARTRGAAVDSRWADAFLIRPLIALKRYPEAELLTRETLGYFSKAQPKAVRLHEYLRLMLSETYLATGQIDRAVETAALALANQTAALKGKPSLDVARAQDVLGIAHNARGEFREAEVLHKAALVMYDAQFGVEHAGSVRSRIYLALAQVGLGSANALLELNALATKLNAVLPPGHRALAQIDQAMAWATLKAGTVDQASRKPTPNRVNLIDL